MDNAIAKSSTTESLEVHEAVAAPVAVVDGQLPASNALERRYRALYERMHDLVIAKSARYAGVDAAADLFHEVMLEFWGRLTGGTLTPDQLNEATIVQAVRNRLVDYLERERAHVSIDPELEESGEIPGIVPLASQVPTDLDVAIARILKRLTPQQHRAWLLHIVEDFTYEETARIMGISVYSVKTHLRMATFAVRAGLIRDGWKSQDRVARGQPATALPATTEASNE